MSKLQLECDEEDLEDEQDDWKDIFRAMQFARKAHRFVLSSDEFEKNITANSFFSAFKESKQVK